MPNLTATEKLNSATDSHAVIDNFVCLYGREDVTVTDKENGHTETVVVTVDVHHFLAETFSKGKKKTHATFAKQ
jgi:phosphodiesterase/alkaline phosphatase D-like protein